MLTVAAATAENSQHTQHNVVELNALPLGNGLGIGFKKGILNFLKFKVNSNKLDLWSTKIKKKFKVHLKV